MPGPWTAVLWRTLGLLLVSGLAGWLLGHALLGLLMAALGSLAWHLYHLYRLDRWLRGGIRSLPPVSGSTRADPAWKAVYQHFFYLRQRSRKRKRKLRRIIKQFRSATAALPDAVVILREDNTIAWCNKASERLLGLRSSKDSGLPIGALVRHPTFIAFIAQQNVDQSIALPAPTNDAIMLRLRIVPYGKKQHLMLATDITQLYRLEQIRRDFVANASHELRTPLTVIGGYLETLRDSEDICAERWQQPLTRMQQQSGRMLHILEDLLLLSRLESRVERPPERPVPVPAMLESIAEDAMALSGEQAHEIQVHADPQYGIIGNEQELRAAFSNLIFNAVRHTSAGSHIAIRWFSDEQGIHLEVEDDGEGIPQEHLSRITERFYRVDGGRKRESGGTGLGLAIVKHVMKNHDGYLSITSLVGIGSLFACTFPSERQQVKSPPPIAGG